MTNPASGYESFMVPTLFGPWATTLIAAANPGPHERILDVGCGTGIVARQAAARSGANRTVTGLDPSPQMLEVARAAAVRERVGVEWREGRAEQLPFPEGSFDLVLCQFALMFVADQTAAFSEMRRVLTANGRLLASTWQGLDRHPFYQALHQVVRQHLGISALQDIFSLGDAQQLRAMATAAGFTRVEVEPVSLTARFPNPEGFLAGEIEVDTAAIPSLQHLDAAARRAIVAAIAADMQSPLAAMTHEGHVVLPFHAQFTRAWR